MSGKKSSWLEQQAPTQACFWSKRTFSSSLVRRSISWPGQTSHLALFLLHPCMENHTRKWMDDNLHACISLQIHPQNQPDGSPIAVSCSRLSFAGVETRGTSIWAGESGLHGYTPFPLSATHTHTPAESVVVSGLTPLLLHWQADYELRLSPSVLQTPAVLHQFHTSLLFPGCQILWC